MPTMKRAVPIIRVRFWNTKPEGTPSKRQQTHQTEKPFERGRTHPTSLQRLRVWTHQTLRRSGSSDILYAEILVLQTNLATASCKGGLFRPTLFGLLSFSLCTA